MLFLIIFPENRKGGMADICTGMFPDQRNRIGNCIGLKIGQYYNVDILNVHDDYGTNDRMFMAPELWRELIKPELARMVEKSIAVLSILWLPMAAM